MPSESTTIAPSAGRACPVHYRYTPNEFSAAPVIEADTVYVAGGLYGNLEALDALEQLAARDARTGHRVAVIFNGDTKSLAGWQFADEYLSSQDSPLRRRSIRLRPDGLARPFLARWPQGGSAHASYFRRLCDAPAYRLDEAVQNAGLQTHASLSEV